MSIEVIPPLIYTTLSGYAGIQSLVTNSDSPVTYRISNRVADQDTARPYLVYQVLFDNPYNTLASADGGDGNKVRVQVSSFSDVESEAYALAKQVRGAIAAATSLTSVYVGTFPNYETDTKLYSVVTDYSVRAA